MSTSYDLMRELHAAWARLAPVLADDPAAFAERRRRRQLGLLRRPPRAWCLAVRASDSRLTPMRFPMVTDHPVWWDRERQCWQHVEHEVTLEAANLRWLCRPVAIPRPGADWRDAAKLLGVDRMAIRAAINRGFFSVRHVKGLGGKFGPPIPIVYTPQLIDPASLPLGNAPDAHWGVTWRFLCDHLPDDLEQTIVRRPVYRPFRGQMKYRGWRWICPGCQRETLRVFYPLSQVIRAEFVRACDPDDPDAPQPFPASFACGRCLSIYDECDFRSQGWDLLIAHLTGGLLRGREVPKPPGYAPRRKKRFVPRPHCRTSKAQAKILPLLIETNMTARQIAKTLAMPLSTVHVHIGRILRHHEAADREHLRKIFAEESLTMRSSKAAG